MGTHHSKVKEKNASSPKDSFKRKGSAKKRDARCTSPQSDGSTHSVAPQLTKKAIVTPLRNKTPIVGKNVSSAEKTPLVRKTTPRRGPPVTQHKPQPLRDQNRVGSGGKGVVAPVVPPVRQQPPVAKPPPPPDPSALQHAARGAQALAVIVQHLVFNLDAFSTPHLKKDLDKIKSKWLRSQLELEELKASFSRLQEEYLMEKSEKEKELEEVEQIHKLEVDEMNDKYREEMDKLTRRFEQSINEMQRKFEIKEENLTRELEKRLEEVSKSAEIEKEVLAERCRRLDELEAKFAECEEAEKAHLAREAELLKQVDDLMIRYENLKQGITLSSALPRENREKSLRTSSCSSLQAEVESLQCVLEIRCNELQELRRQSQIWKRDAADLQPALQRISSLTAKVEDLQAQIARRDEMEKQLQEEKQILSDTLVKESTQKKRLSLQNEELQWKLKQNSLVFNALAGLSNPGTPKIQKTPGKTPSRRISNRASYELNKTASEADINLTRLSEKSPPSSPTVKSVIEKADSVSWVLDLEEPPECIASRILKRAASLPRGSGSPTTGSRLSSSPIKVNWRPQAEEDNITEEVIMVKGIGGEEVLELLSVDESEIYIDDLPKLTGDERRGETAEMLRRVGERGAACLPKDSAGEAMISGEGSDEEPPSASDSENEEEDDEEEETSSSGGDLSETRLFRMNGASDSGSLNMSWAEDVDILPPEGLGH